MEGIVGGALSLFFPSIFLVYHKPCNNTLHVTNIGCSKFKHSSHCESIHKENLFFLMFVKGVLPLVKFVPQQKIKFYM
jgi:hypothetical protein